MSEREFDVVVIGAGPAGEVAAGRLAKRGRATALVEAHLIGGECAFYGCMPSKALLRPPELHEEAERVPGVREAVTGDLDVRAVLRRRDEVIHGLDDSGQEPWLQERGVAIVRGHGRLDGERRVRVEDELLVAREAVIVATGSQALLPPIPGLAEARPWTNREATTSERIPPRLLVLGAGVVGVELAQAYASLGSTVTLVEAAPRILASEEPFAADALDAALRERGIEILTAAPAARVQRDGTGELTLTLENGRLLQGDELLVAVGRKPLTDDLGLETVGIEPGGTLEVDDRMQVPGYPWLYAIGDVNGRALLTHMGKYQARIATLVLDGDEQARATQDGPGSPRVIFTDPQVAAVGMTEAAAREAGIDVRTVSRPTSAIAGASFVGRHTPGTTQLVIDGGRDVIVGATFVGFEVAEMLHAATVAIVNNVPIAQLWACAPPFPTRSETWLRLLEAYELA
ncbi:MAG TPA: NAD(P)/FAD-dependent oxidoreductase [Solirubrobacteraceae bacterium]|jgi:dihydrolipoamide dehydrogenase